MASRRSESHKDSGSFRVEHQGYSESSIEAYHGQITLCRYFLRGSEFPHWAHTFHRAGSGSRTKAKGTARELQGNYGQSRERAKAKDPISFAALIHWDCIQRPAALDAS
ncbi:hypothetical protein E2P81_ATG07433 [Venturia nashicola]|nr:hypothetical protein E2P81_ATG07433 [Venturia nashicola]